AIAAANPHTTVSFALVDYFATLNNWDDGDGAEYHVDIPQFVPSSEFGGDVKQTLQQNVMFNGCNNWCYDDSDFSDNFLHSSSITALYGTIIGSGLDWANDTHHVIVWMGSSAPRDPGYPENYCVSPSTWAGNPSTWGCIGATCEPAYHFPSVTSPNCEGWVKSQDGNATHSIAGLAHSAKQCTESVGGDCTIDMVDYWATPTDPYSKGWPDQFANKGGAPGGPAVLVDAANVITAGCDLAAATGGTWDGPSFATCPDGTSGSLQYVDHGPYDKPTTTNPTLFSALKNIGFGPVTKTQVAAGTGKPIFTYVPFGNIEPSPTLSPTSSCTRGGEPFPSCQQTPTVVHQNGLVYLGWNWSTNSTANVMYVGDSWSASFNVIAVGPPYSLVPVDACTTTDCKAVGSGSIDGLYTWASYVPASNDTVVTQSFPVAELRIQLAPLAPVGTTAPPPPPTPPAVPIPTAPPLPVVQQIGVGNTVGVAQVSLQAAAAGFLGAGFMRVGIKNRPIALRVAAKQSNASFQSKFDAGLSSQGGGVGRFE
ncbi:MAG TPA: hypothetical protein VMH78_04740, partial [Thermoplasmata archaeon]|nr:hypothetical protein [Thermoplasmata archaeon]